MSIINLFTNWNQDHFDDCQKCMCRSCKSIGQCGGCYNCTGSRSMEDDPYANYKEECLDYEECVEHAYPFDPMYIDKMCREISKNARIGQVDLNQAGLIFEEQGDELNSYHTARQDEIENAIFDMIKVLTCRPDMKWDMSLIGPIADLVSDELIRQGYLVYYPSITTEENDEGTISNFYGA